MTVSQVESGQKPVFDPFELWRQFYEANEQTWTKTVKEITTTKDYAEAQGKFLESMLAFQKMLRDSMTAQLNGVNLPSRDDVSRLGELVLSLEEKIDQLDDKMPALIDGLEALEKRVEKLAALEKAIEGVDKRIERLSDRLPERVARQVQKEAEAAAPEPEPAKGRGRAEK